MATLKVDGMIISGVVDITIYKDNKGLLLSYYNGYMTNSIRLDSKEYEVVCNCDISLLTSCVGLLIKGEVGRISNAQSIALLGKVKGRVRCGEDISVNGVWLKEHFKSMLPEGVYDKITITGELGMLNIKFVEEEIVGVCVNGNVECAVSDGDINVKGSILSVLQCTNLIRCKED